ncbi:unnamed protein product [Rhizophagus irregularis]|uniref:Uncharacterized protein n=1 Tax=Rhizophagus irregularis TaxID=588596 RepID=A0A915ZI08_9GLOM|nr:hypothetical protein RIR_jg7033.t1 [Rhizophagus irregularis DAOM 181602=DAOM 197198]CAB4489827.1 unnamed protein product [Rhizophagus irregularis]CAB5204467.1 unnamed protein product [Rhizophagus irregularis]CAB5377392.1 unnamed protein product [Rhizophagus irregularis]
MHVLVQKRKSISYFEIASSNTFIKIKHLIEKVKLLQLKILLDSLHIVSYSLSSSVFLSLLNDLCSPIVI